MPDGQEVAGFLLTNALGMQARLIEYGATLTHLLVPDRSGKLVDVVLGFSSLKGYLGDQPYIGATVGRFANRIANARFLIDNQEVRVTNNEGPHILHGGKVGFDKKVWKGELKATALGSAVRFTCESADGEEGFPGNLQVAVTYTLTFDGAIAIQYEVSTDAPTVVNLTNHSYFNLHGRGPVTGQMLQMFASQFTPGRADGIPTGEILEVDGPFDFRSPKAIGRDLTDVALQNRKGYDHNFVVDGEPGTLRPAAKAWSLQSGILMDTLTTAPCMQLYTGNWLNQSGEKRGGIVEEYQAFCLETQFAPDSPNQPAFDSPVIRPGKPFQSETRYVFSVMD